MRVARAGLTGSSLLSTLALLASACGGSSGGTDIGAVRVRVMAGSGGPALTRVHLEVTPAGNQGDLVLDPATNTWGGTFTVVAGDKTVTATAYAGADVVGSATAAVSVGQHKTAAVALTILDSTTRPDGADHGPVVTAVTASSVTPEANDAITVTAAAFDPDGHALAYSWFDDCGGVFEDAGAASTTWHHPDEAECILTARATANGLSHEVGVSVTTQPPTGEVAVSVEFVPAPYVASLSLLGGPFTPCTIARTDTDASCRPALTRVVPLTATVAFDPVPADSGATVALTSNCGGVTSNPVVDLAAGTAQFTWTPPSAPGSCLVTAIVTRSGLSDSLTVGLGISP